MNKDKFAYLNELNVSLESQLAAADELAKAVKEFLDYGDVFLHHRNDPSPYELGKKALAAYEKARGQ